MVSGTPKRDHISNMNICTWIPHHRGRFLIWCQIWTPRLWSRSSIGPLPSCVLLFLGCPVNEIWSSSFTKVYDGYAIYSHLGSPWVHSTHLCFRKMVERFILWQQELRGANCRLHPRLNRPPPSRIPKDRHSDGDRIRNHGIHRVLRQAHPHSDQQHHCRMKECSLSTAPPILFPIYFT